MYGGHAPLEPARPRSWASLPRYTCPDVGSSAGGASGTAARAAALDGGAVGVPRTAAASDAQSVLFCQGRAVRAAAQWLRSANPRGEGLTDPSPSQVGATPPPPSGCHPPGCHLSRCGGGSDDDDGRAPASDASNTKRSGSGDVDDGRDADWRWAGRAAPLRSLSGELAHQPATLFHQPSATAVR